MTKAATWTWWKILTRRKIIDGKPIEASPLARVLTTFDLTALGIGSTLGVGVYVLAGNVARDSAGPAVIISFLVAAAASVLAGLCYAEFGARVPRAGSAYVYSYVCVGEFIAFIIGWTLILEYVIGSASVARGLSLYIDSLIDNILKTEFLSIAPMNVYFLGSYVDFFAFFIVALLAIAQAFGLKESSLVNNGVTILNLAVVLFVIIAGSLNANTDNWKIEPNNTSEEIQETYHLGYGGFFPFGFEGMLKGAATCFYGFVGFDCIATTGEEVKNPRKAIPLAIIISLAMIFISYFGVSTVVTLMSPYYLQDSNAPIPHVFSEIGWEWARWIVTIGGIFGLAASLYGAMFPLPRIIYAMSNDGLIFRFLGNVSERYKTPIVGTLLAGLLTAIMAAIFDLKQLVDMMSIGTLLAYTLVASSVLILRYTDNRILAEEYEKSDIPESGLITSHERVTGGELLNQLNGGNLDNPTIISATLVKVEVFLFCVLAFVLCICLKSEDLQSGELWATIISSILGIVMFIILLSIAFQPSSKKEIAYKVPFVPLVPAISILINIYLMMMLDINTWIRFGIWMAVGLPIYFTCIKIYKKDFDDLSSFRPKLLRNIQINHAIYNQVDISDECAVPLPEIFPENFQSDKLSITTLNTDKFRFKEEKLQTIDYPENVIDVFETDPYEIVEIREKQSDWEINLDDRKSSAEHAIAFLDEVLLNQNSEDTLVDSENIENGTDDKKSRKVSTVTLSSYHEPISVQHSALVHRENEEEHDNALINRINPEPALEIQASQNEEKENIHTISELLQTNSGPIGPKTPTVSRAQSFLKATLEQNNPDGSVQYDQFVQKLSTLLKDKLEDKPNKVGLVRASKYDSEGENNADKKEEMPPEASSMLDMINKEINVRKRLSGLKKRESLKNDQNKSESSIDESENTKPSDIRFKLEEIYKNGPKFPTKPIIRPQLPLIETSSEIIDSNHSDDDDPNDNSTFAQQLRMKKKLLEAKSESQHTSLPSSPILSRSQNHFSNDNDSEDVESVTDSPNTIRKKLNLIFATGPRNPTQLKNSKRPTIDQNTSTGDKNNENESIKSDVKEKTTNNNKEQQSHINKLDTNTTTKMNEEEQINKQKMLMGNVFKSIQLNRKDSVKETQGDGKKGDTKMNKTSSETNMVPKQKKTSNVKKISQELFNKEQQSSMNKPEANKEKNNNEVDQINNQKMLMSNVFKSIERNRKYSEKETSEKNENVGKTSDTVPKVKKMSNVLKISQELFNKDHTSPTNKVEISNGIKPNEEGQINEQKTHMNNVFKSIELNPVDFVKKEKQKENNEIELKVNKTVNEINTVPRDKKTSNVKKISQEVFNKL